MGTHQALNSITMADFDWLLLLYNSGPPANSPITPIKNHQTYKI